MKSTCDPSEPRTPDLRILLTLGAAALILHVVPTLLGGYGYFRDELYYIACSRRLAAGYVDHPPLSVWLLALVRNTIGDSLFSLRLIPSAIGAAVVVLSGYTAFRLGGGRTAQVVAALATMVSPVILGMTSIYNMNAYDILVWQAAFLVVLRLTESATTPGWIVLGLLIGLGLLNKISAAWLGAGLVVGMLCTPFRRYVLDGRPYLAAAIAFVLFLPFVLWNMHHEWAHLEFVRNASAEKYGSQTPMTFLVGVVGSNNPVAAPLWVAGFWFLFRERGFRLLGWIAVTVGVILLVNVHSKSEYYTPVIPLLLAAGAVQFERLTRRWAVVTRAIYPGLIVLSGIILVPITLAVLPPETFVRYQRTIGISPPSTEGHEMSDLPQHYADRFGWPELAENVAQAWKTLTPEEQKSSVIVATNYGEAAAIEFFGRGLPTTLSGHNSYYVWGMKEYRGEQVFIVLSRDSVRLAESFASTRRAGSTAHRYAMPYENNVGIWICREPRKPFATMWREAKRFI